MAPESSEYRWTARTQKRSKAKQQTQVNWTAGRNEHGSEQITSQHVVCLQLTWNKLNDSKHSMENCLSGVERTACLDSLGQSVREYTPALLLEGFRLTARPGHGYHERETCRHKGPTDKQQELENKLARPLSRTTPTAKASQFRQAHRSTKRNVQMFYKLGYNTPKWLVTPVHKPTSNRSFYSHSFDL